jgi:hypothetical protein
MNVSAPENFAPHSGNEKVVDLDHLDDLDLPSQTPEPVTDVVGSFDILHKQLDPEERDRVVRDFSLVKKPTEIMDRGTDGNQDSDSEDHLVERIDEAVKDEDYDKAYELAKKIENDEVLLSTVQGVIASLISDKKFSLAEKFALLIRDTDAYRKELANIIDNNTDSSSALSDFPEEPPVNTENDSASVSSPVIEGDSGLIANPVDDSAVNRIKINRISEKVSDESDDKKEDVVLGADVEQGDTSSAVEVDASVTEDVPEVIPPIPTVESVNNSEKLEKDLEDSRRELVALEAVWRSKNQQSKSWVRRNLLGNLGLDKQTPLVPEPTELEQAKMVYNLAKKNKLRETIGAGNTVSLLQEVEKEKNAFENLKSTYKPKVVKESQLNRNIRTGILGLNPKEEEGTVYEVEQGAIAEKFSSSVKKGIEVWSKLPKPVQLATSTALVTGTSFTFGLAAAAGPLGYAGYRVAKSALVGGVVSQPFGKVVDKIHERKNIASQKESLSEFSEGINLDNFMEKEAERMARDEKMIDAKKRQRFVKAIGKVAVGGIASAGMELTGASDILFGPKDIDLPGKGTLNVPNDYGDMDKYLDKLDKTRVANTETLTSDNHLDNLEQFKPTIEDNNPIVTETKVELSSKGFMQDMHNLKANIMAEYGGEVPDSLKPIMNKTPMELAKAFHFYDQGSNASGLGFKGESLGVDSNGDIFYEHLDGNKQIIFDAEKGEFHHFDGKMVGSTSKVVPGSEIYPNGKIGDDVYSKLDYGGNKIITPDPIVKTAGVEVLEGDPIFKTEAVSVLDVKDTTAEEIANNNISHIEVAGGKSVDVWRMGEDKIVSFDGARIGQEIEENGKRVLVLDDTYQDGAQYEIYRNAFSKAFEQNTSVDVVGPNPIAESFEGGKIYISYNVPNDPNSIRVLLNGKEIATGSTTVVDRNGIPKIRMHGNLKGGWFLVDNAYERAFKHIDKLIKAGNFNFKI